MQVMNIGVIVKNNYGDTFPVALTPNMVGVIQNLLIQIPEMQSNIVRPDGMKAAKSQPSIPIIPRNVDFNWAEAYKPLPPEEEKVLMENIVERYRVLDLEAIADAEKTAKEAGVPLETDKPALLTDPENPFNLELEGKGRSNVVTDINGNPVPIEQPDDPIESEGAAEQPKPVDKPEGGDDQNDSLEERAEISETNKDVTVTPDTLGIGAGAETPGN